MWSTQSSIRYLGHIRLVAWIQSHETLCEAKMSECRWQFWKSSYGFAIFYSICQTSHMHWCSVSELERAEKGLKGGLYHILRKGYRAQTIYQNLDSRKRMELHWIYTSTWQNRKRALCFKCRKIACRRDCFDEDLNKVRVDGCIDWRHSFNLPMDKLRRFTHGDMSVVNQGISSDPNCSSIENDSSTGQGDLRKVDATSGPYTYRPLQKLLKLGGDGPCSNLRQDLCLADICKQLK